ncbi:MAG: hypothetical protein ACRELB_07750, partial [Polyangiaceae bacterium]
VLTRVSWGRLRPRLPMNRLLGRSLLALPLLVLAWALGCDQATGTVRGGQALIQAPTGCAASCVSPTWSCLYDSCFGPSGQASCSTAQGSCHADGSQTGSQISGFVCGGTKDSCWQGLVFGIPGSFPPVLPCLSQVADGDGGDGAAGDDAGTTTTVNECDAGAVDPTTTAFYRALHQPSSSSDNTLCSGNITFDCNMPCGDPIACHAQVATYTFTPDDLARISAWIEQGAPDN